MDGFLNQYSDQFYDDFPIFITRGMTEKKINNIIQKCFDSGKPYEVDTDPESDY